MDHGLRPRQREFFIGFTKGEMERMDKLVRESGEEVLAKEFCQNLAKSFNRSVGRAGKPIVKWIQVQNWFQERIQEFPNILKDLQGVCPSTKAPKTKEKPKVQSKAEEKIPESELEFEARSSKDGAWYDVDMFLCHRVASAGETEVRVRFVGFGAEEDEWVNVKKAVRERSVPLENSECSSLKVGDHVLCLLEKRDQAIYYDAHIIEIHRRMHDIRGCRCLFFIRYNHDNNEEKVRLRRLCRRPIR
ncbi:PREDICTED: protein SAWADEE HOMEODOMAIN HOMOLOG 1-like [Fragaria vesca subsp. vesca]|uniref:protein SAWADEE HOMEODOMAIN HOMOLOG 1-like n=1 Tax=Fragaria vesca subsp. vesca TaxID=101020 RepID=UPI0002C35B21|nr:PREDICTED: protein SAWADEE HOMEODOMAIN HOMOLOG 1-like [Fragaria vesca subsp. vesca]